MDTGIHSNTSDPVDRTENIKFEEIQEERAIKDAVERAVRAAEHAKAWIKHLESISYSVAIEQLEKDLGVISIESQERK